MTLQRAEEKVVLVIEDDEVIRFLLVDVLEERGFGVHCASNGAEAIDMLESMRPHVIVLDLLMPVMHGWGFMEEYVRQTDTPIPIIVLSVNPILPRSFDRLGVYRCMGKPFDVEELIEAVEEACGLVPA